jgi:acyl-CoA synthetase (AMP-forming)/AMP-acid ligase II
MTASLVSQIVPFWAARTPDRIALIEGERACTYGELDQYIKAASNWLTSKGVRPGDRVMLVCENSVAAVAIFFACNAIGAWPSVVNARLSDREIEDIREHSGARCMIFTAVALPRDRVRAQSLGAVLEDLPSLGQVAITPANEACDAEELDENPEQNIAALIYTSGTTGRPKGVMLSHANLMFVARESGKARAFTESDQVLAALPISHILGLTGVLLGSLLYGASVHLVSRFDPAAILTTLKNGALSVMVGTPSMYAMLSEYAGRKSLVPIPAPALRLISSAGAPLDLATKTAAETVFARTLHNGYGITECSPTITLTSSGMPRSDTGIGDLLTGVEAKLCAANGDEVAEGEIGELFIRSPGVMKGYYKAPAETAAVVDAQGWFRSGDLARFADGSYFIAGRAKEMIIRFGFNVYPAEVEGVLNGHAGVAHSAVVGRQAEGSEEIVAFVQPTPGANLDVIALADFAAAKLAPYKRPTAIRLLAALPMSPAGKILKSELAAIA